jgi:hypothetical protein
MLPMQEMGVKTQHGGPHLSLMLPSWNTSGHAWQTLIINTVDLGG